MFKIIKHPLFWFFILLLIIFRESLFQGHILAPVDTLVGSYYPWLDSKWGYPVGVPVKNPPISDVFSQFFIWKHLSVDILKQGALPLWNKFALSGTPFLASFHSAVFFPGNILLLLPRYLGWNLYLIASTFFAGLFMYLFLGQLIKNPWSKLAGSLVFAFAGPMSTWFEFGTGVWAAAFLPLSLYLADLYLQKQKPIFLSLLSLSIATLILAGHVQLTTYTFAILPFFIISRGRDIKKIIFLGVSSILGIGIAAIQLLPTLEFFPLSIRSGEKYAADFRYGLSPLIEMIRLWSSDFFGHPSTYNHWSSVSYHEYSSYLGSLSLPLIVGLFFSKVRKNYAFFFILFFLSLFLAFDNPISYLIFSLPLPLLTYSSASRLFFITLFSAAVLVSASIDQLYKKKLNIIPVITTCISLVLISAVTIILTSQEHRNIALRNSVIPVALLLFFTASLVALRRKTLLLLILIPLIFAMDFARYFQKYNPQVPSHLAFPNMPAINFIQQQKGTFRISRAKTNLIPPNTWTMYGLEAIEGYDPLRLLNYNKLFNVINKSNYFSRPSRYSELENFDPRFLDALNVKYFVSLKPGLAGDADITLPILKKHNYQQVFTDGSVIVYQSPTVKDRAYFVDHYTLVDSEEELAKRLMSTDFDPRSEAILTTAPHTLPSQPKKSEVKVVSYDSNSVSIRASTDTTSLLVLADTYAPGWHVKIDGTKTSIYQANGALRSVIVPPGQHQIDFYYFPKSLQYGLIVSLVSFLTVLLSLFYFRMKK